MSQCIPWSGTEATSPSQEIEAKVDEAIDWLRPRLLELLRGFLEAPRTPAGFVAFELALVTLLREFGRALLESCLNGLEGDGQLLPHDVIYRSQGYRRLAKKTRNAYVASLFGNLKLWRFPYRFWDVSVKEPAIFPLELELGLVQGVTPALAGQIGQRMAEAGATQKRVLKWLKSEHHVALGVGRLRDVVSALHEGLECHRQTAQVDVLLDALQQADAKLGNRRPVIAVGRDGVTLCEYVHRFWEVATTATVSVMDRKGKRVVTVTLACPPELGQAEMTRMLTDLLKELLCRWEGSIPTLAYISDSGNQETSYYSKVLSRMRHPRTKERLKWQRVADFYHAAERVGAMSANLFGKESVKGKKWIRRMLRLLKAKPRGAKRLLHSAAYFAKRTDMSDTAKKEFRKAYQYIRKRTRWMHYHDYKKRRIPIGSGLTEAACKTVFAQRLKLSGMRWSSDGARHILTLRTILLSHTWQATYGRYLETKESLIPIPYAPVSPETEQIAA